VLKSTLSVHTGSGWTAHPLQKQQPMRLPACALVGRSTAAVPNIKRQPTTRVNTPSLPPAFQLPCLMSVYLPSAAVSGMLLPNTEVAIYGLTFLDGTQTILGLMSWSAWPSP
jgi:hypothetical protein